MVFAHCHLASAESLAIVVTMSRLLAIEIAYWQCSRAWYSVRHIVADTVVRR